MKCVSCGYHKNDPSQATCNLCGAVLGDAPAAAPAADVRFGPGNRRGASKKVEQKGIDGPTPDQIVYAGEFAIVYAFVLDTGGLVVLKPGEVFTFGRGDACDHKIDSKTVSRRHARVHWQGTEPPVPELVDLESRNGVLVNGTPVDRKLLEDGDEVTMGTLTATMRVLAANTSFEAQISVDRLSATTAASQRMWGEIKLISIPWFLGHLERCRESGTLNVQHEKESGYVALISGVVIAAGHGKDIGEEAVRKVAKMKQGRFSFSPNADATPQSIGKKLSEILGLGPRPSGGGRPPPGGRRPPPPGQGGTRRPGPPPRRRRPPPPPSR